LADLVEVVAVVVVVLAAEVLEVPFCNLSFLFFFEVEKIGYRLLACFVS
jgi:hypothetical protein